MEQVTLSQICVAFKPTGSMSNVVGQFQPLHFIRLLFTVLRAGLSVWLVYSQANGLSSPMAFLAIH